MENKLKKGRLQIFEKFEIGNYLVKNCTLESNPQDTFVIDISFRLGDMCPDKVNIFLEELKISLDKEVKEHIDDLVNPQHHIWVVDEPKSKTKKAYYKSEYYFYTKNKYHFFELKDKMKAIVTNILT